MVTINTICRIKRGNSRGSLSVVNIFKSKLFDMLGFKSKYDSWYALISIYQLKLIDIKKTNLQ